MFDNLGSINIGMLFLILLIVSAIYIILIAINYIKAKKIIGEAERYKLTAYQDILTKVPNRAKFLLDIEEKIKDGKRFALMFTDLDGFKGVNDNLGHDAGDKLLINVAQTMNSMLEDPSEVYRLGGDEFAIIFMNFENDASIMEKAREIQKNIRNIDNVDGESIKIDCSVGIAIYPDNGSNKDDLLIAADNAMYHIKENGKGDAYFFTKGLEEKIRSEREIERSIEDGINKNQFTIAYRPRVTVNDISDKSVYINSALRWNHPVLGTISPKYFLKIAIQTGLIIKLEEFVLKEIMELIEACEKKGIDNVGFCVKMSMKHFSNAQYRKNIKEIIRSSNAKHAKLLFEITENIDVKNIELLKLAIDNEFKDLEGVQFIIDNIVIREETVNLIKTLPVKEIKVDKTFLDDINKYSDFIKYTVKLIHAVDAEALIIGVDTSEKYEIAKKLGFDIVEGDYISKPLNRLELIKKVKGKI